MNLNGTTGTVLVQNCCVGGNGFQGSGVAVSTGNNNASTNTSANNFGSGSGNEVNINLANEFVSTAIGNPDFCKVRNDGGGECFDGGITPAITANTAGIRGTQRPQGNGDVSIGSDELPTTGGGGGGGSGSGGGGISGAITAAMAAGY
jgi:hypothetical protein